MKICVIGSGYVGLVSGAGLAHLGHHVVCADIDEQKIDALIAGKTPIYETGLDELIREGRESERLSFSTDLKTAIAHCEIVMIAVGTPQSDNGAAELGGVFETALSIGEHIRGFTVIACKSTVPPGTCDLIHGLVKSRTDEPFCVASNPEFLREGRAVADFLHPTRIVIGSDDKIAEKVLRQCYAPLFSTTKIQEKFVCMDLKSAELCKYAANAYLATRIAFVNEIASLCEKVGADVTQVRVGAGTDPRIGLDYFHPGPGFGGSCLPKDLDALLNTARSAGVSLEIATAVKHSNNRQKLIAVEKLREIITGELSDCTVAVWGLSFKPDTDDIRESPAISIVQQLIDAGASVHAHDPVAIDNFKKVVGHQPSYFEAPLAALRGANALIVVTDWEHYSNVDLMAVASALDGHIVIDCRNIWASRQIPTNWSYLGLGVPARSPSKQNHA